MTNLEKMSQKVTNLWKKESCKLDIKSDKIVKKCHKNEKNEKRWQTSKKYSQTSEKKWQKKDKLVKKS